jgi:hypothetical protein
MFLVNDLFLTIVLPVSFLVLICVAVVLVGRYISRGTKGKQDLSTPGGNSSSNGSTVPTRPPQPQSDSTTPTWRSDDAEGIDVDVSVFAPKVVPRLEPFGLISLRNQPPVWQPVFVAGSA